MDKRATVLGRGTETITDAPSYQPVLRTEPAPAHVSPAPKRFVRGIRGLLGRHMEGELVSDLDGLAVEEAYRRERGCEPLTPGSRMSGLIDCKRGALGVEVKTVLVPPSVGRAMRRLIGRRRIAMPGQVTRPAEVVTVEIEHCVIAATREVRAMIDRSSPHEVMTWLMASLLGHADHWGRQRQVRYLRYALFLRDRDLDVLTCDEQPMTIPFLHPSSLEAELTATKNLHVIDRATGARVLSWYLNGGQVKAYLTVDLTNTALFRLDASPVSAKASR